MSNVVDFDGVTKLDIDPDRILSAATGEMDGVIVIGYTKDGEEYFASSYADGADALWHLMRAQKQLLAIPDE